MEGFYFFPPFYDKLPKVGGKMLTVSYILSQLFAIIYYIIFAITYYMKNKKTILVLGVISIFIHSISYALLGGWTAVAMGLVAVLRNLIFISEEKKDKKNNIILYTLYLITISSGIFTYDSIFSVFPVIATILYTYSIWQSNTKTYKLLGVITGILCTIYNIYIKSIFGLIAEFVLTICSLHGYIIDLKGVKNEKIIKN